MNGALRIALPAGDVGRRSAPAAEHRDLLAQRCGRRPVGRCPPAAQAQPRRRRLELRWCDDALALADDPEIDVVVELIGGSDGCQAADRDRIANRKHVVTANKALLATTARRWRWRPSGRRHAGL